MNKKIDLTKSIYELTEENPQLIEIMAELGFSEITKKAMRHSVGKIITIPKGAKMKNISMAQVVAALFSHGYQIEGEMPLGMANDECINKAEESLNVGEQFSRKQRVELLKSYLYRLGQGEDLEKVRADFIMNFSSVDASEIMDAEKELMQTGTDVGEIQRLCDLHSALFHGVTAEEHANAADEETEKAVINSSEKTVDLTDKHSITRALVSIKGHPLETLTRENQALEALIENLKIEIKGGASAVESKVEPLLEQIRQLSLHYAKKGDLLYPHLNVAYEISGPSNVMWTVDDEIRDELSRLAAVKTKDENWLQKLDEVLTRAEEMIYKEQNILFPICAVNFTEEEWYGIYNDSKDYGHCFNVIGNVWEEAETHFTNVEEHARENGEITMPGGHMSVEQITALLNTIPLEITFVDENNINRFFNEGPKVFKRPAMAIDRDVFTCHPPKIEPMVRQIIESLRDGTRDSVPIWMNKNGRTMLVTYMAVRNKKNEYLGTMEIVQDMEFAKEHFMRNI